MEKRYKILYGFLLCLLLVGITMAYHMEGSYDLNVDETARTEWLDDRNETIAVNDELENMIEEKYMLIVIAEFTNEYRRIIGMNNLTKIGTATTSLRDIQ